MTDTEPEHDLQQTLTGGFHEHPDPDSDPDRDLQQALQTSQTIVDRFHEQTNPDYIYALVSGGGDSDTACEVAQDCRIDLDGIVHVNTGIGIEQTRRYVMSRCIDWNTEFHELTSADDAMRKCQTDGFSTRERTQGEHEKFADLDANYHGVRRESDDYENLVRKMGLPGPKMHWICYLALKHKPICNFVETYHDDDDVVAFVSGVRQDESDRRAKNMSDDGISENWGNCPVVSPIAEWTASNVTDYRLDRALPSNPVSDLLGMSGECLCGAYASRDELETLKRWGFDDAVRQIEQLEQEIYNQQVAKGYVDEQYSLWGHGNKQPVNAVSEEARPQMMLCADCENNCDPALSPTDEEARTNAEIAVTERVHCNEWDRWFYCPDCQSVFDDPMEHRQTAHALTRGGPYLDHIPWNVREISLPSGKSAGEQFEEPVTTDPELTKDRRMRNSVAQTLTPPLHTCEFTPTDHDGIHHCDECGTYQIHTDGTLRNLIADATDGPPIEHLMQTEPGVLSTAILHTDVDEAAVISSHSELETTLTSDEVATLLSEQVNSLSAYLDTDPTFSRLVRDAGIDVFLDRFDLSPADVLDPETHETILTDLTDAAADEDAEGDPFLQQRFKPDTEFVPGQQFINSND